MEMQTTSPPDHDHHQNPYAASSAKDYYHSNVDSSRPFRSVKEAVAIFGERFLAGEIYAPKSFEFPKQETPICFYTPSPSPQISQEFTSWRSVESSIHDESSNNNSSSLAETLKKLEAELEDTKMELKKLKERESETEVALASLNAELHKNMSKLAQAEAAAAGKAAGMTSRSVVPDRKSPGRRDQDEEERRRDLLARLERSPTLAQMLSTAADKEGWFEANFKKVEKKKVKKKPIIPLVGDLFSRKKGSPTSVLNPLYSSSHLRLN